MKKFLLLLFFLVIAGLIIYLTFIIAKLKIQIGIILLIISAILFFAAWVMWKSRE